MINLQELEKLKQITFDTGGRTREDIIESAGWAIYTYLTQHYVDWSKKKIVFVCDASERGGYGLTVAHFLDENYVDIKIWLIKNKETEISATKEKIERIRPEVFCSDEAYFLKEVEKADIVVDAVERMDPKTIEKINAIKKEVISLEAPSGIDLTRDKAIKPFIDADHILTMHDTKKALESFGDKVVILDVGLADFSVD